MISRSVTQIRLQRFPVNIKAVGFEVLMAVDYEALLFIVFVLLCFVTNLTTLHSFIMCSLYSKMKVYNVS